MAVTRNDHAHRQHKPMNIIEQLKKLDEQRAALLANAKTEALEKAKTAIAELNSLGFYYTLREGAATKRKTVTRNTDPSKKHCPVCDIDGHDARAHRGQGKNKKKFTGVELKGLGLG
jgi:hypothetical protein